MLAAKGRSCEELSDQNHTFTCGSHDGVQSMQWGGNRLTRGLCGFSVTVPPPNQGPARAAKALHVAFCHLPCPAPVWARSCLHQLPRQLPWRL